VTALLHTVHLERKFSIYKAWNIFLIASAYLVTIFGTFIVRSGILQSVHAFSDTGSGIYFLTYIILVIVVLVYLVYRSKVIGDTTKKDTIGINILVGGALILSITGFLVWIATIYPLFTPFITGDKINLTQEFFNTITAPLFATTILLMGIWPAIGYGNKISTKQIKWIVILLTISFGVGGLIYYFAKGPITAVIGYIVCVLAFISIFKETMSMIVKRLKEGKIKYGNLFYKTPIGAHVVHLGIVILAVGVITTQVYSQDYTKTLTYGETTEVSGYHITYEGLNNVPDIAEMTVYASLPVSNGEEILYDLKPSRAFYENWQPISRVAIDGNWAKDVYVQMAGWDELGQQATFIIHINPLMRMIWFGGFLLAFGGFIAFLKSRKELK